MDSPKQEKSKKKVKWYNQSFNLEWLKDPEFKDWLQQDKDNAEASFCKCCNSTMKNANRSTLMKHKHSVKHKNNFKIAKSTHNINQFIKIKNTTEDEQIIKSELFIAGYFSEHNIPFIHADHFLEVCKRAFPDSEIASKLAMKKTKVAYVIQDGIAFDEKCQITEICKKQKFSIIIDESTDISVTQILAVVVRYFDSDKQDVADSLLDIVTVENGTAQGLYNAVKSLLQEKNIPLNNIIGFGSDNCSSMMGIKSGFQKLLKDDVPSVFIMGCVCHSFALCASYACKVLPSYLEAFLKDITSYFSRSGKRQRDFTDIQDVIKLANHKIPKLAQTRWLSREKVISSILEQYDAVVIYFQSESKIDKIDGAKKIYDTLINCGTKHMLLFLHYILQKVNALNIEFQSEHFRLHQLYLNVSFEYKNILSFFIKDELLKSKLSDIDPKNKSNYKNIEDIYLGGRATAQLISQPFQDDNATKRFKGDCLNFLAELASQIKKRFPFNEDGVISKLQILDPKIAGDVNQSPTSIVPLASHFPSLVPECQLNELDDQWRSFRLSAENLTLSYKSIPQFWHLLSNLKDGLNQDKFSILCNFMKHLTVLPHSSACVERIFSQINCMKTKINNSLKTDSVRDRLLAKQHINRGSMTCTNWIPKETLIRSLRDGSVYKRYKKRLSIQKERNETLHLSAEIEEEVEEEVEEEGEEEGEEEKEEI